MAPSTERPKMKRTFWGNVLTCAFKDLPKLRAENPGEEFFVVKVCNSARGYTWDYDMTTNCPEVAPEWKYINSHRAGTMSLPMFRFQYKRRVEPVWDEKIVPELEIVFALAGKRTIVFCCHEQTGYCHRHDFLEIGFEKGAWVALLDRDKLMCGVCYMSNCEECGELWSEDPWNQVIGYIHGRECDDKEWCYVG